MRRLSRLRCYGTWAETPWRLGSIAATCSLFLGRDGSDDFLEARLAAQRIPEGKQFQLTVADTARRTEDERKLFTGEIFVTNPRCDHREILDHVLANKCIFFHGKKLDRAPAFSQCLLFPAETGIDQTQHAQCRAEIWLSLDGFFLLRACSDKSFPRFAIVVCHARDKAFEKRTIERNLIGVEEKLVFADRAQGVFC